MRKCERVRARCIGPRMLISWSALLKLLGGQFVDLKRALDACVVD